MSRADFELTVLSVLGTVLRRQLAPGCNYTRQANPDWDSLKHVEFVLSLEEALGVEFAEDEFAQLDSVSRVIDALVAKHEA